MTDTAIAASQVLGIDLGGTKVKLLFAGLEPDSDYQATQVLDTPSGSMAEFLNLLAPHLANRDLAHVVLTIPGIVDATGKNVMNSVNVPWLNGQNIPSQFAAITSAHVSAMHDGRAAALAEATQGAGKGRDHVLVVTLGTGIASAYVLDGRVTGGAHGAAGELGHIVIGRSTTPCTCGQVGCLETLIGGKHLARRWAQVTGSPATAEQLCQAAREGDVRARAITDEASEGLAQAFLALICLQDPSKIVVGGGIAHAWDVLVEPAIARARELATFHFMPPIVPAELGMWAGAWGAVLNARQLAAGPLAY